MSKKRINIWFPKIGKRTISSKESLHKIIETDYPGIKRNPRFLKLIADAENHLILIKKIGDSFKLKRGDISRLARELNFSIQTTYSFLKCQGRPRLYHLIDLCISKTKAQIRLTEIENENCGVSSTKEVLRRISNFYLNEDLGSSLNARNHLLQVDKYFLALKLLASGGHFSEVASRVGASRLQVKRWFSSEGKPFFIHLASQIPKEPPWIGNKWLPTYIDPYGVHSPSNFIQVPQTLNSWEQIEQVLCQLTERNDQKMREWQTQFGKISKGNAFAYVLGMIVSDAAKNSTRSYSSTSFELTLTKAKYWSEKVGEATCYYLGKLGIKANLGTPVFSKLGHEQHHWYGSRTPFLRWILRSVLGIESVNCTTYQPIRCEWIQKAPFEIRHKFLQALNDGDGFASVTGQIIGNACIPNISFLIRLLNTLNIESSPRSDRKQVVIRKAESIIQAARLPFFLHATSRQINAEKLAKMLRKRRHQSRGLYHEDVVIEILTLKRKGHSFGDIAEKVFDKYGFSFSRSSIDHIIRSRSILGYY
ncbi:MAG: hypothetical protein ACFFCF_09315 [Promethearchaeota archaeon]